jgi:hypothetical protein
VIKEEFDAFKARDLAGVELDYLFLDAAVFKLRPGAPAEPGRCCIWTIRGRVKLGPLSLDQIAKARSSNATVSRWPAGTSTASS